MNVFFLFSASVAAQISPAQMSAHREVGQSGETSEQLKGGHCGRAARPRLTQHDGGHDARAHDDSFGSEFCLNVAGNFEA